MATKLYMGVLAVVFLGAILAATYASIPSWIVWLVGIGFALVILTVGLTIYGGQLLDRGVKLVDDADDAQTPDASNGSDSDRDRT
ncbi:MAG: hypothetical protein AAF493_23565 [Pseudomonadota bacterium]